ncbi:MAG TPA: hypothetical protein GX406_01955 [Pseudoclavibacter sp.]|nr:hypothetical protein [Pseudoclavibacter sp.]
MTVTASIIHVDCSNCDYSGPAVEVDDPVLMWRSWRCPWCGVETETSGGPELGRLDAEDPDLLRDLVLDDWREDG